MAWIHNPGGYPKLKGGAIPTAPKKKDKNDIVQPVVIEPISKEDLLINKSLEEIKEDKDNNININPNQLVIGNTQQIVQSGKVINLSVIDVEKKPTVNKAVRGRGKQQQVEQVKQEQSEEKSTWEPME